MYCNKPAATALQHGLEHAALILTYRCAGSFHHAGTINSSIEPWYGSPPSSYRATLASVYVHDRQPGLDNSGVRSTLPVTRGVLPRCENSGLFRHAAKRMIEMRTARLLVNVFVSPRTCFYCFITSWSVGPSHPGRSDANCRSLSEQQNHPIGAARRTGVEWDADSRRKGRMRSEPGYCGGRPNVERHGPTAVSPASPHDLNDASNQNRGGPGPDRPNHESVQYTAVHS
ncbi:hypothetical protein LXA43DRAFT_541792 [Ganoderma leucocontextum]|nr:hypothetical protein LXA43DRAFT_541792 [Ganoderma leucocontextum]